MKSLFATQSDDSSPTTMRGFFASRISEKRHLLEGIRERSWVELHKATLKKLSSCGMAAVFMTFGAFGTDQDIAQSVTQLVGAEQVAHAERVAAENEQKAFEREEILWFARAVYSESEFTDEQEYVAWAIRNRVANKWYPDTYQEVVLQPHQFSGLNEYDRWYEVNISRDYDNGDHVWRSALAVAQEVYYANEFDRMLPSGVMHFYSPVAVDTPDWAQGLEPVKELHGRRGVRFAFYQGVQ